ncbi:MAG: UDP-N-acetylmuramate dehydrogenase [Proteobacteria bacterium]|nr:UDP-N-acetylmuramate dehydrogenase [Pseudomonadota bacterium]MBU2228280.1 UDP-N-acetylmuramate dehydrogenase [Pseudomonadota bacterium]MBU2262911.1 UDP-N-acetylmuramate dehydrogenase [Pseudomonadota bacterium]
MDEAEDFRDSLRNIVNGEALFDEPADRHTSLGVGGRIDALVFPESEAEIARLVAFLRSNRIPFLPVGNWTNLIVRDGGYRGVLIALSRLRGLSLGENGDGGILLKAEAGVPLSELVNLSVRESLTGMEFCAGIPGSVGGAIRMNAGAYGSEIKDVIAMVRLLEPSGGFRIATSDTLCFSYRNLDLPPETIIIGAVFRLRRGNAEEIAGRTREIIEKRREKHPLEFRNAGSVFKNPQGVPAGRLIEETGLKGMRIGDAQVSEKHGNFIVNRGHATAEEILNLIALIRQRVFAATGYALETEVKIIGE